MSLTSLWKSQQNELSEKHIQAMVGLAGDGKLRDDSVASREFRDFLTHVPSTLLARYANECLGAEKFSEASAALQDVINEVGRRLGFAVENGLYRGKVNQIGHDGLWRSDDKSAILLEVKTTDTYTIDLDTLADYRKALAAAKKLNIEKSSILIVVGRSDTGSWEAQVRGSRHAWDIRMISVDALLRLVTVKEELEDPQVVGKIRQILRPKEYTKIDDIIDLVFSAAEDVKQEGGLPEEADAQQGDKKVSPVDFRDACISKLQAHLKTVLIQRSAALFSSADEKTAVICLNSRAYAHGENRSGYWFGFRLHQRDALAQAPNGYGAFGCGSAENIILVPAKAFLGWLDKFHTTDRNGRFYWHVRIEQENSNWVMIAKAGIKPIDVSKYVLK